MWNKSLARIDLVGASKGMVRRTRSQFKTDDLAFPVRVKFVVPGDGLRITSRLDAWLNENLGPANWGWGPAHGITGQATAYYFRRPDHAQRFCEAFPELELADGVASSIYDRPGNIRAEP